MCILILQDLSVVFCFCTAAKVNRNPERALFSSYVTGFPSFQDHLQSSGMSTNCKVSTKDQLLFSAGERIILLLMHLVLLFLTTCDDNQLFVVTNIFEISLHQKVFSPVLTELSGLWFIIHWRFCLLISCALACFYSYQAESLCSGIFYLRVHNKENFSSCVLGVCIFKGSLSSFSKHPFC